MIRGLYISASGMTAQELNQDRVTNNLANAETTGFKKDSYAFKTFRNIFLERVNRSGTAKLSGQEVGSLNYGTVIDAAVTDFAEGLLQETGNKLDLALQGKGFFSVETAQGLRFTRNGAFRLDNEGYLVTAEGDYVLGYQGRINLQDFNFSVGPTGNVTVDDWPVDQLLLADFEDWQRLQKIGNGLFSAPDDLAPQPAENVTVKQGFVEKANINAIKEMVDLIAIMRVYEANQKAVQAHDETLGKSVNEVGSIR